MKDMKRNLFKIYYIGKNTGLIIWIINIQIDLIYIRRAQHDDVKMAFIMFVQIAENRRYWPPEIRW